MFAWRARIGLIKPTHRGKTFGFWYKHAPDGVEIVPTFIGFRTGKKEAFLQGFDRAEEIAVQLKEVGCDIIQISGTPPFLLKGLDFERQFASDLSKKIGLPVVTAVEVKAGAGTLYGSKTMLKLRVPRKSFEYETNCSSVSIYKNKQPY